MKHKAIDRSQKKHPAGINHHPNASCAYDHTRLALVQVPGSGILFNDHCSIMASETERIAQSCADRAFLRLVKSKVEPWINIRIVNEMIDRWWNDIVCDAHNAGDRLNYTRGAQAMTGH